MKGAATTNMRYKVTIEQHIYKTICILRVRTTRGAVSFTGQAWEETLIEWLIDWSFIWFPEADGAQYIILNMQR